MDFWAVILVVIAYVVVYCYEGIINGTDRRGLA